MGNASGNYQSNVDSVDIELDFEIDPNSGQDELRKFGYYFNKKGQCRSIKDDERVGRFPSQKEYEQFGAALERYIFFLLKHQYNMTEKIIKSTNGNNEENNNEEEKKEKKKKKEKTTECTQDKANEKIAASRIYLSPQYGEKETLLLLIPGSGSVRSGQWARSICINDNLAAGCMYPFISSAYKRDWGIVLFDPNGRTQTGKVFSDEHVMYVYDEYIERAYLSKKNCLIKNILIICHSAGGMATTHLLNDKTKYLLPRIRAVAGTDTFFGRAQNKLTQQVYQQRIVNWVTSSQPLGTILSTGATASGTVKRVSAGHTAHEYTSASAFPQIISYFDAMLKSHNQNNNNNKNNKNNQNNKKKQDKMEIDNE